MAFNPRQIDPLDFQKDIAVGVNLPFSFPSVFKSNFTTRDAIKYNLINYFLTNPGDCPLKPNFGGGLRHYIFEHINTDNLDFIKEEISSKISNLFPDIDVRSLEILRQEDSNTIIVNIIYDIVGTGLSDTVSINFA